MKRIQLAARVFISFAAGAALAYASDPTAVYASIDKVVMEPNADSPETIQVWGVFSMAKPGTTNDYLPAARGYLYFKVPDNKDVARREWADLKEVAGTGQVVAFGSRWESKARLRKRDQRPENPDPYAINIGVRKVRGDTDYPPVRALLDYKD